MSQNAIKLLLPEERMSMEESIHTLSTAHIFYATVRGKHAFCSPMEGSTMNRFSMEMSPT